MTANNEEQEELGKLWRGEIPFGNIVLEQNQKISEPEPPISRRSMRAQNQNESELEEKKKPKSPKKLSLAKHINDQLEPALEEEKLTKYPKSPSLEKVIDDQ